MSNRLGLQPEHLFCIETNDAFPHTPVPLTDEICEVARRYGFMQVNAAEQIGKRNTNSLLLLIEAGGQRVVLRAIDAAQGHILEQQASLAHRVAYSRIVKPIIARDGIYSIEIGGHAWCAYPFKQGTIYRGTVCPVREVIGEAIALEAAFAALELALPQNERDTLPAVAHKPEAWVNFFMQLTNPVMLQQWPALHDVLSQNTKELLFTNQDFLLVLVASLATLPVAREMGLVHNDLQHANVLIADGAPFFLDIEDICYENPLIAIAHAVFKLLRHTIYIGYHSPEVVRTEILPEVLADLGVGHFRIAGRDELFSYGAYRIVSDIHEIGEYTLTREHSQLYDFEKRLHNLFELIYLLEE